MLAGAANILLTVLALVQCIGLCSCQMQQLLSRAPASTYGITRFLKPVADADDDAPRVSDVVSCPGLFAVKSAGVQDDGLSSSDGADVTAIYPPRTDLSVSRDSTLATFPACQRGGRSTRAVSLPLVI